MPATRSRTASLLAAAGAAFAVSAMIAQRPLSPMTLLLDNEMAGTCLRCRCQQH